MSLIPKRRSRWWRQPDHFEWFSNYLRVRGIATRMRGLMVAVSLSLAALSLATLFSTMPPTGTVCAALVVLSGVGATAAALLWLTRFPTRRQSVAFALGSSVSIAMSAVAQSDPFVAILACMAFASLSGYIALFHSAPLMTTNLTVALGVSIQPAWLLAESEGVVIAACAYGVVVVVNVAVPCVVQVVVHALGVDVLRADRDPLTGLYTRRAFYRRALGLIGVEGDGHLVMALIDLDKFKQLNDTRGHAEGDRVLAAVGHALREHARNGAVVGRLGGEEFLIADVFPTSRPDLFGQRLCDAVAALPHRITASVGTASVRCRDMPSGNDAAPIIDALVAAADAAMYAAKRNGGDQTRHHRAALPTDASGEPTRTWNDVDKRWERLSPPPVRDPLAPAAAAREVNRGQRVDPPADRSRWDTRPLATGASRTTHPSPHGPMRPRSTVVLVPSRSGRSRILR